MATYGYIRTSRTQEPGHAGSDPEAQRKQLTHAGVNPKHIYADIGTSGSTGVNSRNQWHALDQKLTKGDVLVVAAIDRISRRYLDTMWGRLQPATPRRPATVSSRQRRAVDCLLGR